MRRCMRWNPALAASAQTYGIGFQSQFFEVTGQLRYEQHVIRERTLVQRTGLNTNVIRRGTEVILEVEQQQLDLGFVAGVIQKSGQDREQLLHEVSTKLASLTLREDASVLEPAA